MPNALAKLRPEPSRVRLRVEVDEEIELQWSERLRRPLWEEAVFTLRGVRVSGDGPARWYGVGDAWQEAVPDPRRAYDWRQGQLVRKAQAGRDYDEVRHVGGR